MRVSLPPEVLHAIRLSTWRALFETYGYPPSISGTTESLADVSASLATQDLPIPLARALFTVLAFSTEVGRADLYAAADALGQAARWPDSVSPADLVASLLAAAPSSPEIADLLTAARILRDRAFRPHASYVYLGDARLEPTIGEPTQYADPLRASFAAWATTHDFGAVLPVRACAIAGVFHYTIVHEDRATTYVPADGAARTLRGLRSHHLTYEPSARRLLITTDCIEAVTPLATVAGSVFFSAPRHFLDTPAVALWPLQELGRAALAVRELSFKVKTDAIGGTWHSGKGHAITPRGPDFFKALARYKIHIEGGWLDLVTLRGVLPANDGAPGTCDVVLRPPHHLTVSEPEVTPLMHELLDLAGILSPEERLHDFFSFQPWIDVAGPWIIAEGEEGFAQLVAEGVLKADPSNRSVTPPSHPHAGRSATAYPLGGTRFLALSPDRTIAPFMVEERDLIVYALQFGKLAAKIATALGLESPATKLDDDGVLYCGHRPLGPTRVLFFLLTRPIRKATVSRLREAAGHGHAVLVMPEKRMEDCGLRELPMPKLAGPWQPLLGMVVRALRIENDVDTPLYAPEGSRIVVHRATTRVWIDGTRCDALDEDDVRLLEILITQTARLVHTKDIAEHVSRGNPTEDTTRRAIASFLAAVKKSFAAKKAKVPKDLATLITMPRHGLYTLHAKGFVD